METVLKLFWLYVVMENNWSSILYTSYYHEPFFILKNEQLRNFSFLFVSVAMATDISKSISAFCRSEDNGNRLRSLFRFSKGLFDPKPPLWWQLVAKHKVINPSPCLYVIMENYPKCPLDFYKNQFPPSFFFFNSCWKHVFAKPISCWAWASELINDSSLPCHLHISNYTSITKQIRNILWSC